MSGYRLWFLLHATTLNEAFSVANSTMDEWFRDGILAEGDKGYILETDGNQMPVCGADDPRWFVKTLKEAQHMRISTHIATVASTEAYLKKAGLKNGFADVGRLPLADVTNTGDRSDVEMAGWSLARLGRLVNRAAVPYAGLFNVETHNAGIDPEEMKEISKHPEEWALIPVVVG
jgi:hypothetical protein